jgi:pantoate--beta-alanine ligase
MQQAENREQIRSATRRWRQEGQKIALVPTMGNLHDGHLALVEAARAEADRVITSIFVNPAQFGAGEDFESYPRTLEADRRLLEQSGCDLLFVPNHRTVYPHGLGNAVRLLAPPDLAASLEGDSRPGHFDGVITVVARLFNLVDPDIAVFGEKDYQQLLVIGRLVDDLGFGIRIVPVSTMREASGLAMSSRNNYLEPAQRKAAGELNAVLFEAAERIKGEASDTTGVERAAVVRLESLGFRVEYVAIRRAEDLGMPGAADQQLRILASAWCGETRLIDNIGIIRVGI